MICGDYKSNNEVTILLNTEFSTNGETGFKLINKNAIKNLQFTLIDFLLNTTILFSIDIKANKNCIFTIIERNPAGNITSQIEIPPNE